MKIKLLILNFIAVFVVAFALTTFFHEFAHAIIAKILHVYPVLYHTYVSYDNTGTLAVHQLYIAAAGPFVSFSQAVFFLILLRLKFRFDLLGLLFLWMAIMGMVVVCGYVMIGPFIPYGDTGKIYEILPIPKIVTYIFSIGALFVVSLYMTFKAGEVSTGVQTFQSTGAAVKSAAATSAPSSYGGMVGGC